MKYKHNGTQHENKTHLHRLLCYLYISIHILQELICTFQKHILRLFHEKSTMRKSETDITFILPQQNHSAVGAI